MLRDTQEGTHPLCGVQVCKHAHKVHKASSLVGMFQEEGCAASSWQLLCAWMEVFATEVGAGVMGHLYSRHAGC